MKGVRQSMIVDLPLPFGPTMAIRFCAVGRRSRSRVISSPTQAVADAAEAL